MKLLLRLLAVSSLFTAAHSFAAGSFEGKVSLAISTEKGKPQEMNYSMKGKRLRIDTNAEGHQAGIIMDVEKLEMLIMMDEQRMYMVMPIKKPVEKAMANNNDKSNVDVERTGKTEKILGYTCDQILVKDTEKGTVTEMWVASDLGMFMGLGGGGGNPMMGGRRGGNSADAAKWEEALKGKGGFPLRVISRTAAGKQTFKMEATKIEPGSLPESMFVPPEGYQKFDMGALNPFRRN